MQSIKIPTLFLSLLFTLIHSRPNLIPYPQEASFQNASLPLHPCSIEFTFLSLQFFDKFIPPQYYFSMISFFYQKTFPELDCSFKQRGKSFSSPPSSKHQKTLKIHVNNIEESAPSYPALDTDESYTLSLDPSEWLLQAQNYVGFLRGIEAFMQLIEREDSESAAEYQISHYPVRIKDGPSLVYRGVMIDTARHFMKIKMIKHVLDGMLFHKLNVLHWHITDTESFPIQLDSFPEITQYAVYSGKEVYSKEDVKEIVEYARYRGIRVIPEIDSPGHSYCWGFAPGTSEIVMDCLKFGHFGQLNPSLNKTYDVVQGILNDLSKLFPDPVVHLGGDEVSFRCWESDPAVKAFMAENNISSGVQLQQYYKDRVKTLLPRDKTAMFWFNDANFEYDPSDILHFWAADKNYEFLSNYSNKVVLSTSNYLYIDVGYGNGFGNPSWGPFSTWKNIYSFNPFPKEIERERVLGGEVTLWSEVNSDETTDNHLWSRTSAFAERLWNAEINRGNSGLADVVTRLYANEKRLIRRGFQPSPVSSQFCYKYVEKCF